MTTSQPLRCVECGAVVRTMAQRCGPCFRADMARYFRERAAAARAQDAAAQRGMFGDEESS